MSPIGLRDVESAAEERKNAGQIVSIIVDLVGLAVLMYLFAKRSSQIRSWRVLTVGQWTIFLIYSFAFTFMFFTTFIKSTFGLNNNYDACTAVFLLCIALYFAAKALIYFFLIERAYLVRASGIPRYREGMWLFNMTAMLLPMTGIWIAGFVLINEEVSEVDGKCLARLSKGLAVTALVVDTLSTGYLTTLFLVPLMTTFSFKNREMNHSHRLQIIAKRTLIGCIGELVPSVVNMSLQIGLAVEPGWLCMLTCNSDILISTLIIHWITCPDDQDYAQHCTIRGCTNCINPTAGMIEPEKPPAPPPKAGPHPGLSTIEITTTGDLNMMSGGDLSTASTLEGDPQKMDVSQMERAMVF